MMLHVLWNWLLQTGPHGPHGPMTPHGGYGGGVMPWHVTGTAGLGGLWTLVAILGLVAVLGAVVYLASREWRFRGRGTDRNGDAAPDVLRDRYARGDISTEQFETRRARLTGHDTDHDRATD